MTVCLFLFVVVVVGGGGGGGGGCVVIAVVKQATKTVQRPCLATSTNTNNNRY